MVQCSLLSLEIRQTETCAMLCEYSFVLLLKKIPYFLAPFQKSSGNGCSIRKNSEIVFLVIAVFRLKNLSAGGITLRTHS